MDHSLTVFCDGSAARTPSRPVGALSWAWLARDDRTGKTVSFCSQNSQDIGTAVVAEYCSIIAGLKALAAMGHRGPARVCNDNQGVVRQIRGDWQVTAPNLEPYFLDAANLVADLERAGCQVELVLIPREENLADALLRPAIKTNRTNKRAAGRLNEAELASLLDGAQEAQQQPEQVIRPARPGQVSATVQKFDGWDGEL